jgi:hypothetical protein
MLLVPSFLILLASFLELLLPLASVLFSMAYGDVLVIANTLRCSVINMLCSVQSNTGSRPCDSVQGSILLPTNDGHIECFWKISRDFS